MGEEENKRKIKYSRMPLIFEVDINHLCWFCDVTEKNPDTVIISTFSRFWGDLIVNTIQLSSPDPKKVIEFIKKHPLVKKVEVVNITPNSALLFVTSSYQAMTYKILHRSNVVLLESPITKEGVDSEILLAPSYKAMVEFLNRLKEEKNYNEIKLKRKHYLRPEDSVSLNIFKTSGFFDLKTAKEMLTAKQFEIFSLACRYGYYDNPKKITINELAELVGVAPSTLAEHLRKIEAKIMPILLKIMHKV
ncbi:MAG: helix-turn-helix domain-containing protein [Candidatus Bilamarchaeaceae archaeon]